MSAPRFLIVRLSAIGDVIHTLPALMDLRSAFPESEVDWLVEPACAALLENSGAVDRVIAVPTKEWRKAPLSAATWKDAAGTIRQLRRRRYTAALDFQGLLKSAAAARLSGASEVLGIGSTDLRESSAQIFYDRQAAPAGNVHRIETNRALLSLLGVSRAGPARYPAKLWSQADELRVSSLLQAIPEDFVVLNPGAGWKTKRWPADRYGELARRIHARSGHAVVCTWGPGEENLLADLQRAASPAPIAPLRLSITEFACLIRHARMFVGGDTGPMHIAAAYRVPILTIFGPTTVEQNGPYQAPHAVAQHILSCSHCYLRTCWHHSCMQFLETDRVWKAFERFDREIGNRK